MGTNYEEEQLRNLKRMRWIATSLLVLMLLLFLVASKVESNSVWFEMLKAFSEAAMVGALADWFAVVALFRRPLGLPIPHTAVIPSNKDRIGESIGNFIESNFLTPPVLKEKLKTIDFSQVLSQWLGKPDNQEIVTDRVVKLLPGLVNSLSEEQMKHLLASALMKELRSLQLAPLTASVLAGLSATNQHQFFLDELLKLACESLAKNREFVQSRIFEEIPGGSMPFISGARELAAKILTDKLLRKIEELRNEVSENPDHELRNRFDVSTRSLISKLNTSPEYHRKCEELKERALEDEELKKYLESLWPGARRFILSDLAGPDSRLRAVIHKMLVNCGRELGENPTLQLLINEWFQNVILEFVLRYKHEVNSLISGTVKQWDMQTISEKVELQVGKDLQYIRINGTIVGGIVGLIIYFVTQFL